MKRDELRIDEIRLDLVLMTMVTNDDDDNNETFAHIVTLYAIISDNLVQLELSLVSSTVC